MTEDERNRAVVDCGFTERQARFLVLVMRHGGICIPRQYASFAGIANGGRRCNAFFDKLVRRGYTITSDCIHNRAHVVHSLFQRRQVAEPVGQAGASLVEQDQAAEGRQAR